LPYAASCRSCPDTIGIVWMANNACHSPTNISRPNAPPRGRTLRRWQISLNAISLQHQSLYGRFSKWPCTACLKPFASPFVAGKPRLYCTRL